MLISNAPNKLSSSLTQKVEEAKPVLSKLSRIFLLSVALYLISGNLARLVSLPGLRDNLPFTSFILYTVGLTYILFHPSTLGHILRVTPIFAIIIISTVYGTIIHGFQLIPVLYAVRLILLLMLSMAFGRMTYLVYRNNIKHVFQFYINIYLVIFILGMTIYGVFPDSIVLWQFLSSYNIVFNGDPHQHRFYSAYLDPNFYAAIACIPILLCNYIYITTKQKINIIYIALFAFSIILSGSRSGGATLFFVLVLIGFKEIVLLTHLKIRRTTLTAFGILLILGISLLPLYFDNLLRLFERLVSISNDPSAQSRLTSFQYGLELLLQFPIFGIGYNYLYDYMRKIGVVASVDSSILATLVNFGIMLTGILAAIFLGWVIKFYQKMANSRAKQFQTFCIQYLLYTFFAIIFTSQFINLLYYEFWLFPMFAIGTYLSLVASKISREKVDRSADLGFHG